MSSCATQRNKKVLEVVQSAKIEVLSEKETETEEIDNGVTETKRVIEKVEEKPRITKTVTVPFKNGSVENIDSIGNVIKITMDSLTKVLTVNVDFIGGFIKTKTTEDIKEQKDFSLTTKNKEKNDSSSTAKTKTKKIDKETKRSPSVKFWIFVSVLFLLILFFMYQRFKNRLRW